MKRPTPPPELGGEIVRSSRTSPAQSVDVSGKEVLSVKIKTERPGKHVLESWRDMTTAINSKT